MNIVYEKLAKRYARAFINAAQEQLNDEHIEMLRRLADFVEREHEALFYVQLSVLDDQRARTALLDVCKQCNVIPLFMSLIDLLLEHKRISLLPRILRAIINLYNEKHNIMHFTIESAHELRESEKQSIEQYLAQKTGKTIVSHNKINQNLIAGLKVYSETVGFEQSIAKIVRSIRGA